MKPTLRTILSELRHWTLPGGVLLGAMALWVRLAPDSPLLTEAVEGYPYAVYGVGILLAWRLRRSRVAAALLLVVAVTLLPDLASGWPRVALREALGAAGLPLAWLGLASLSDRPLFSRRGLAGPGVVVLASGAAAGAAALWPEATAEILRTPLPMADRLPWSPPARLFLPVVLGAGVLTVAAVRRGPVERALWWSLPSVEAALVLGPGGVSGGAFLLAAGLILGAAVVESSYVEAYHDELTGLPARRALNHALERTGRSYTLAMVDVDHFKRFNDRHGHDVGDQVLRMVAARLRRGPGTGRAFRYGGEEFTLLYPKTEPSEARPRLEAVRRSVEEARFVLREPGRKRKGPGARDEKRASKSKKTLSVTVSIGVAGPREPGEDPFRVLDRADQALYRAKEKGRNRVEA